MPFHVKDPETDYVVRELAAEYDAGITETIKRAAKAELERIRAEPSVEEKIKALQDRIAARAPGSTAGDISTDKAFFDWLSGEEGE